MKIEKLWAVWDPTALSEEADIISECTVEKLCHLIIGMAALSRLHKSTGFTLYTEEQEARDDAQGRLRARDGALRASTTLQ